MSNIIVGIITFIIISIWTILICKQIENKNLKKQIIILCLLLLFWVLIRIIKYDFVKNDMIAKYIWYIYYFPNLFSSTIFLNIGTWHNKNKKFIKMIKKISIIGSSILFLLVITNDIHNWVFNISKYNYDDYTYNFGYYLCLIWTFLNIIISIIYAIKDGNDLYKKQKFIILSIIFLLVFSYAIGYMNKSILVTKYFKDFILLYSICYMLALIIIVYKEKYKLSIEETLYDEIEDAIKDKTILINKLLNNISKSKNKKRDLAYIKLLISYCKGKSNLIVVQKNKEYYSTDELKLFINNSFQDAKSLGINGAINIINKFELSIYNVSIIYTYLYNLFEYASKFNNSNILINIDKKDNYVNIKTMFNSEDKMIPFEYNFEMNKYLNSRNILEEQIKSDNSLNINLKIPIDIKGLSKINLSDKEINNVLKIKTKIHDILGQRLSILSCLVEEEKIDINKINEIKPLLKNILDDLNSNKKMDPNEMLEQLIYTCELSGTNLYVIGNLTNNYLKNLAIVKIIRECSTNAIRHAKVKNIYVSIKESNNIELVISNDGKIPKTYKEGDGIKGLKMRVQELNGSLEIIISEKFIVKITI